MSGMPRAPRAPELVGSNWSCSRRSFPRCPEWPFSGIRPNPAPRRWCGARRMRPERGMARQGYDLQLTRYDERGWRATFYTTGMEHSITSATASAWERTPWHAVQGAARDALRQANRDGWTAAQEEARAK